jgi:hypothetical protein
MLLRCHSSNFQAHAKATVFKQQNGGMVANFIVGLCPVFKGFDPQKNKSEII